MLVKQFMTKEVVCCTPWDSAQVAASLMTAYDVGAIPVVWDTTDPLLEGVITDRDLCCGVVADARHAEAMSVSDLMTLVPVTCEPDSTIEDCAELMRENQVQWIPVVDKRGRCVGIVTQADIARHAPATEVSQTIRAISQVAKKDQRIPIDTNYFYCGQTHEQDQILLLNRRRHAQREVEVLP
jgi:CBS domain-containing protein